MAIILMDKCMCFFERVFIVLHLCNKNHFFSANIGLEAIAKKIANDIFRSHKLSLLRENLRYWRSRICEYLRFLRQQEPCRLCES